MLEFLKVILLISLMTPLCAKDTIIFAPLPVENIKTVFTQFNPMITYLEKLLDKKIIIDYNQNYADILEKFKQKKVDIAYLGPLPYIELKDKYPTALPLVHFKNNNGNAFYKCSIITFATNNTKLENIKNKKIALTQPLSTCGYLSVNALLEKSNNSLNNNKYSYLGKHDTVALSVVRGEFDFGGVKSSIAKKYSNLGLKELTKTGFLPGFALIGNQETLSLKTLQKIQTVMKNVKKEDSQNWGKNISYGCSEAKDSDYNTLRKAKKIITIPTQSNF